MSQRRNRGGDNDGKEEDTDAKTDASRDIHMQRVETENRQVDEGQRVGVNGKKTKQTLESV